jgi:pimeloyl-ACP methyl ester carboxylesterase
MMLAAEPGSPIRRLVLNDFGARISAAALRRIGAYLLRSWHFDTIEQAEAHLRDIHAPFGRLTDEQWRHLTIHSLSAVASGGFRFHHDPAIAGRFAVPLFLDVVLWHLWERIACPVLVLRGEESDLLSRETVAAMRQRGAAAHANRVEVVSIPGCGHAPALMDDAQIVLVRDFLLRNAEPLCAPPSRRAPSQSALRTLP